MSKRELIEKIEQLDGFNAIVEDPEMAKCWSKIVGTSKSDITSKGACLLKAFQQHPNESFTSREVFNLINGKYTTRSITGILNGLVSSGYISKESKDPIKYKITENGIKKEIEEEESN